VDAELNQDVINDRHAMLMQRHNKLVEDRPGFELTEKAARQGYKDL